MGNFNGKTWPPERIKRLRELWNSGHTAAQIAEIFGNGTTRHAVIGAAHRHGGCNARPSPITRLSDEERAKRPRYKRPHPAAIVIDVLGDGEKKRRGGRPRQYDETPANTAAAVAPAPKSSPLVRPAVRIHEPRQAEAVADDGKRGVAFPDLRADGCKWAVTPHTVPAPQHRFCNAPRLPERPYCAQHCEKARGVAKIATGEALEHLADVDRAGKAA